MERTHGFRTDGLDSPNSLPETIGFQQPRLEPQGGEPAGKLRLTALKKPESLLPQAGPDGDSPHLLLRGKNLREERQMWKTYGKNQSFFKAQPLQKL